MNRRLLVRPWIICGFIFALQPARPAIAADDLLAGLDQEELESTSTIKNRAQKNEEVFIPLLAPAPRKTVAGSHSENVFHGWVRARQLYQRINNGAYSTSSRLDSSGSVERIQRNRLSFVWNGNLTYRNGNSFSAADDYKRARLRLFQFALAQRQDDGGVGRLGRFLPVELPGLGYIDGVQMERHPTESFHVGALIGMRPERRELGISSREPITSGYGSYEQGRPGERYYGGTLGFFQSLFGGVRDELGMLYDQRADLGPKFSSYLTSQVNFNSGAAQVHKEDARLTRLDFSMNSPLNDFVAVRAGLNHYERPDTAAERDLSGGDVASFDNGYWRFWAGSRQRLPWSLQLDEEVGLIQAPGQAYLTQLRGTITRNGIFRWSQALLSFTAYSLNRIDGEGAGTILSAIFPLLDNRLNVSASSGFRYSGQQGQSKSLHANDDSVYINWFISRAWEADLGVTQTYQDYIQSTLVDASLSYRW